MTMNLPTLFSISALILSVGLASPAALAQDKMGKDGMAKDTMSDVKAKGSASLRGEVTKQTTLPK